MLGNIVILTSFGFACLYPVNLLLFGKDPLKQHFHRFHLGLPLIVGVVAAIFVLKNFPAETIIFTLIWLVLFACLTAGSWNKDQPHFYGLIGVTVLGVTAYNQILFHYFPSHWGIFFIWCLWGLIFCASLFAMNLGHWYLNVHGLPIGYLKLSVYFLWALLLVRLVYDIAAVFTAKVIYLGELRSLISFIGTIEGMLLLVGVFFGTLLPFGALFLVHQILKLKNTQAATGILYVILCAVLIGDITYKYYFFKYGILM